MPSDEAVRLRAYTPRLRAAAAALQAIALANLVELALRVVEDTLLPQEVERAPLWLLVRRIFFFTLLPWLFWLVLRAFCGATLAVRDGGLCVRAQWGSVEVPRADLGAVRAFRVPLPEPGFTVAARKSSLSFSAAAAQALGASPPADAAARERMRFLHKPAVKLGLVPAALTAILFRLHQIITYGGLMGEARLFGLRRWLNTLLGVALYSFCMLLVAAAALRVLVELAAMLTSLLPARWAARARLALEGGAALLYYGGLAAMLVLRLGL
ncbi:MAG TPA: hypothetical protein VFL36_11135 [Myxococcales bacterium]|nr:hypothetical protein [Myxococcales bacterium]